LLLSLKHHIAQQHRSVLQTPRRPRNPERRQDGRGNLRKNREGPAPTVGRWRRYHCDPNAAHQCRPRTVFVATWRAASRLKTPHPAFKTPRPASKRCVFFGCDAARHVATKAAPSLC